MGDASRMRTVRGNQREAVAKAQGRGEGGWDP